LDIDKKDIIVPENKDKIPYATMGAYGQAFSDMLSGPTFGNQTLEELENARVAALQGDLENQYGFQADEMTKRLNRQAAAQGMFGSSSRTGNIEQGLSELGRQQMVEFNKGAADIRGERPELLLQEKQQRAQIADMWGRMDQQMQATNLDAMLNNKLMEYERQAKNGELTLSAFEGNINKLSLFLKYMVSKADTDNDTAILGAQIDKIYAEMNEAQRAAFRDWVELNMRSLGLGGFGNG
jgi:DNA helicase IV